MNASRPDGRSRSFHAPVFRLSRAALAAGMLIGGAAHAQQQSSDPQKLDTVIVTGIRKSLETSVNLKRGAQGLVDGIVAEDIGKFPDTNLAEAMQRISGVSIDRVNGEGSKVTVRGVGPDFNLVLLNGRQMPGANIEGTTASSSRSFDFANLASEGVAALEVYKTSRASSPTGGMGATINIRTARPLDRKTLVASIGVKGVFDESNDRLTDESKGKKVTPEISGIYSNVFADGTLGIGISGSYQQRHLGYNQAGVPNGWITFAGDSNAWNALPPAGAPGSELITNRPDASDVYSRAQNIGYSVNGVKSERTNGQLVLQYAPSKNLTATVDFTYSELLLETRRNDLSAWFNFGPGTSIWSDGPAAGPLIFAENIPAATADLAMGSGLFARKNENKSTGLNVAWKLNSSLSFELDAHSSTAEAGPNSPYGTDAVIGSASFNRGTTSVDFRNDFPVLIIDGTQLNAAGQMATGSSFRNSYTKSQVDQVQLKSKWQLENGAALDFGIASTKVKNRSAFAAVDNGSWGGEGTAADYPDTLWRADSLTKYFSELKGSNDPRMFNQWHVWNFEAVRAVAAGINGNPARYLAPTEYTTDRRTSEDSQSAFVQFSDSWDWGVPMDGAIGLRYERTKVSSSALVPSANGIEWGSNNELTVIRDGSSTFTTLDGKYDYLLPSIDWSADLGTATKLRLSYGENIGRPGWGDIQGGQTIDGLVRFGGGTGSQGNPALKPLKAKSWDFSLEHYYKRGSYVALSLFEKKISNYLGKAEITAQPFGLRTPIGGALFNEAVTQGCVNTDVTCIRNYILRTYNGTRGVTMTGTDTNGNATGVIVGQPNDPIADFRITVAANQRSDKLNGLELNFQHTFDNGFGFSANYTKVKSGLKYDDARLGEQFAIPGISNSANLVLFYEDETWGARVAYNWRDKFLTSLFDGSGPNPIYVEAYGQVDMSLSYNWDKNLSLQFEAINVTDATSRSHQRRQEILHFATQTGPRYVVGARYKF